MREELESVAAEHGFSGVVGVEIDGALEAWAFGLADRRHGIANTTDQRFGIASGTKTLTAAAVLSAASDGAMDLDVPVRELLGDDLPLVDDRVTARQLLNHRSGIGDYLDEDTLPDSLGYVMTLPLHTLDGAEGYLAAIDGFPQVSEPGTDFAYNNGGYVLLGILLERATGNSYHDEVRSRVIEPAGMDSTAFLRSDELPGDAALGYLHGDGLRTNVLHLPVVGFGDGGAFTTCGDVHRLWHALVEGRLGDDMFELMTTPGAAGDPYGMGLWLPDSVPDAAQMVGGDAGVSFVSTRFGNGTIATVLSNTTEGAWPISRRLAERLGPTD